MIASPGSQRKPRNVFHAGCVALLCLIMSLAPSPSVARTSIVPPSSPTNHLVIAGSGTNLSITRLLAKAFMQIHPEIGIEIPESIGSGAAIRAAADGAIPIGLISRPLEGKEKKLGLTVLDYARTALVIGVHPSVPDNAITYSDFVNIYRGTKNRWKDGKEIIVLTREPGESSIEVLMKEIPGFTEVYDASQKAALWSTIHKDQVMNQTLAKTPSAIGLSDLGTITVEHLNIKPLMINGIAPSLKNINNNTYKLVKTLSLVYRKENLQRPAKLFLDFVQSKNAANILNTNGFIFGK